MTNTFPCPAYNRVAADFDPNYPRSVNSQEELEALGPGWFTDAVEAAAWVPPSLTGPTFEEYIGKGYPAASYPPPGYTEVDSPALREYRAAQALAVAAEDAARRVADAAEVAAAEKAAALSVLDGKILKAMDANDGAEVNRLEAEKAELVK